MFKINLQYQYQGFSIVLQYKTARLVHPWDPVVIREEMDYDVPELRITVEGTVAKFK